jgi:hypothetical protein
MAFLVASQAKTDQSYETWRHQLCLEGSSHSLTDLMPALLRVREIRKCQKQILIPCAEDGFRYRRVDQFGTIGWIARRLSESELAPAVMEPEIVSAAGETLRCPMPWIKR